MTTIFKNTGNISISKKHLWDSAGLDNPKYRMNKKPSTLNALLKKETYLQIQCENQNLAQRPVSYLILVFLVDLQFLQILKKRKNKSRLEMQIC